MQPATQLYIDGNPTLSDPDDLRSVLKYAVVPKEKQGDPAFRSDDPAEILTLADDLSVEIVLAMIGDTIKHEFENIEDLSANIALRKGVIGAMTAICSGEVDADYVEAVDGVPPTLGFMKTLEVMFDKDAKPGSGILTKDTPYISDKASWVHLDEHDSWSGFMFMQNPDVALSDALRDIKPFRGECCGALQLAILLGGLNALGADKMNALQKCYGPAFLGIVYLNAKNQKKPVPTLAKQFILGDIPVDPNHAPDQILAVPGDFLYFKNKDDYPKLCQGGWQGENCIYIGQDHLGRPHYSGLGLSWKTEFALRMFLGNAYFNDTNEAYLTDRRASKKSDHVPHIVENPMEQVRFTIRHVMRCPPETGTSPEFILPKSGPPIRDDEEFIAVLTSLWFEPITPGHYANADIKLGKFMETLEIGDLEMSRRPSSGPNDPGLMVSLGNWAVYIEPVGSAGTPLTKDDDVVINVVRRP